MFEPKDPGHTDEPFGDSEIHVWVAEFDPHADAQIEDSSILSGPEMARAAAFHFEADQARYRHAHTVLRRVLGRYTGMAPESVSFRTNTNGKPALESNPLGIQFNLSHSKDLVAVAVCKGRPIGVDIEKRTPIDHLADIARMIMSGPEKRAFTDLAHRQQIDYFYRCWVRKEACVKAIGSGIGDDLNGIHVMQGGRSCRRTVLDLGLRGTHRYWHIVDVDPHPDYAGAVCAASDCKAPERFTIVQLT